MAKKRRKLNKDMEKDISTGKQTVELINAKINDIEEEDILLEYKQAFQKTFLEFTTLSQYYVTSGYTTESQQMLDNYNNYLSKFLSEYEL